MKKIPLINSALVAGTLFCFSAYSTNAAIIHLDGLNSFATGTHSITAGGQTFDGYVLNEGGTGWLLIGHGREGWQFDTDGQGGTNNDGAGALDGANLGIQAGFSPTLYSDAIINSLLSNSSADLTGAEVRLRRASNTTGTTFQEGRWNNWTATTWTGDLDQGSNAGSLTVDWQIVNNELGGTFSSTNTGTRDALAGGTPVTGNDGTRVFTWAWGSHANQQGFSYGQAVGGTNNNSATTFMWENGNENHAIPYTEVYIRLNNPTGVPEPSSLLLAGIGGLGLTLRRRRK